MGKRGVAIVREIYEENHTFEEFSFKRNGEHRRAISVRSCDTVTSGSIGTTNCTLGVSSKTAFKRNFFGRATE